MFQPAIITTPPRRSASPPGSSPNAAPSEIVEEPGRRRPGIFLKALLVSRQLVNNIKKSLAANLGERCLALRTTALILTALTLVGCEATVVKEPPAPGQQRPIIVDDAMRHRDWSTSVAVIPTGGTVAGPTLFAFQPTSTAAWPLDGSYFEIPIFLGNIAVLPIVATFDPPWTPTVYRGANVRPSYTMSPAYVEDLPASPAYQYAHRHKSGEEADAPAARHYRKNASTRPVF